MSSFQSQYGLRLSKEFGGGMKWAEKDKDVLKHFSKEQRRIRNEWMQRRAQGVAPQQTEAILEQLKQVFISMAGGGQH